VASLRELFGKRLRELRLEKGFNQLYLAQLSDTSEDFISLVERGINAPSFETIEALASALDTDATALFTFPDVENARRRVRMLSRNKPGRGAAKLKRGTGKR
jgi:transcriptional regulator with XRE-family HTH domain